MATLAPLQVVNDIPTDVLAVLNSLTLLRNRIDAIVGENDGIDLAFAPKGGALDLVIHAKVNSDPTRKAFLLETQPLSGAFFKDVTVKPDPKATHRKLVVAKIVAALPA